MTRWKLRIAGGLTLLSLLALSPPSTCAGWRTKAEQRPKEPPTDCQFGYYGTGWRAWPEGCRDGSDCSGHSLPYATPFTPPASPFGSPAMSMPPSWSNQPWSAPAPMISPSLTPQSSPMQAAPMPAAPSPWSSYREYLPQQNVAPMQPAPQFAPPKLPPPVFVPSQLPNGSAPPLPPPVPPMSEQRPTPPAPQAIRNPVPPLPTTTRTSAPTANTNNVQPVGAWTRNGSTSPIVTLGAEFTETVPAPQRPAINPLSPHPSFSSVPKSLIGPKDVSSARPQRSPNPVTLMSPE